MTGRVEFIQPSGDSVVSTRGLLKQRLQACLSKAAHSSLTMKPPGWWPVKQRNRGHSGAHLVIVEDGVGHRVLAWHCGGPQLLHEEHLVGERGHDSCSTHRAAGHMESQQRRFPDSANLAQAPQESLTWLDRGLCSLAQSQHVSVSMPLACWSPAPYHP